MNKTDLIKAIAEDTGLTKQDAKNALESLISNVTKTLKTDKKVAILGFGTFSTAKREARTGINPQTKTKIEIPAKRVVKFKAGSILSDSVK